MMSLMDTFLSGISSHSATKVSAMRSIVLSAFMEVLASLSVMMIVPRLLYVAFSYISRTNFKICAVINFDSSGREGAIWGYSW